MSSSDDPKSKRGRRPRERTEREDKGAETSWFANHPASRTDVNLESRRPEARSPSGFDSKIPSKRGAPPPAFFHGEVPKEPVLVSIVTPSQDALGYTHAFVTSYCQRRFRAGVAEALSVAAHELLENAVTYGSVSGRVLFEVVERQGSAAVRVTNETTAARIDMLRTHVEKMAVKGSALVAEEMKRTMGMRHGKPMLGLARVVQEAGLALEIYIVSRGRITVLARANT